MTENVLTPHTEPQAEPKLRRNIAWRTPSVLERALMFMELVWLITHR